ncbi:heterokaryon incompatibility protein-domain-containing protein [Xylaria grammica]|nr:heterokaryon incompatibility protein-domain-containing protein [Xylaria grammica]
MQGNLCLRCRDLGLSHELFKIKVNPNLPPNDLIDQFVPAMHQRIDVGTMTRIRDSAATCELCALISSSVNDLPLEERQDDVRCHLYWEIDGRTFDKAGSQINCTRRLRIGWDAEWSKQYEAHIILVAPENYDRSDVDYSSRVDDTSQFLGRRIGSNVGKKNLIREFLHLCEREHKNCTGHLGIEDPFARILQESYFGVIDIENESLVPLKHQKTEDGSFTFARYAAVSYVWGASTSQRHSTRKANIGYRRKSGGLAEVISSLPLALRQSIQLVHSMGIQFIWIDSLCIVQDSGRNFDLNAKAMHSIYGNSTITICAAEGRDATTGLLALEKRPEQEIAKVAEGTSLVLHRPCEVSIDTTEWNSRAWTFQERLLSRRCLIFTDQRIFFQCRSTTISEDIFPDKQGNGWSLELVGAPLQMLPLLKTRALSFYTKCVSLYTKRALSEPFDRLAAFSGMCSLMEETMAAPFTFGLPISHFDFAMLWQPTGKSVTLTKPRHADDPRYKNMRFPTWSWSGWQGESAEYSRHMVEGCLSDVRRWLMNHTWIDWHIRDEHGTLRRLWQNEYNEDKSEIVEWRGYCHPKSTVANAGPIATEKAIYTIDGTKEVDVDPEFVAIKMNGVLLAPTDHARGTANTLNGTRVWGNSNEAYSHQMPRDQRSVDHFGRFIRRNVQIVSHNSEFSLTLPEDPYRVCTTANNESLTSMPNQPLLQFFTWRKEFSLVWNAAPASNADFRRSRNQRNTDFWRCRNPRNDETGTAEPLTQCHIQHRSGDKCGSIKVDTEWLLGKVRQTRFEFIALSDAKSFTEEEFPDWTFYIPLERYECDWRLYFVLLVEYNETEGIYRRVALGKVFKDAFKHTEDEWKEIILG